MTGILKKTRLFFKFIRDAGKTLAGYSYDAARFIRYSCVCRNDSDRCWLATRTMMEVHSIERALSLKEVKPGFGARRIPGLIALLRRHKELGYEPAAFSFMSGVAVLDSYLSYHEKIGYKLDLELNGFNELKGLLSHQRTSFLAGTKQMTKEGCLENARMDFACLALNRVSVRDFSGVKVSTDQIKKAVRIAQKSPSVCNRQSTRIYFMNDASKLVQGSFLSGIRGMEGLIKQALIVTSDLSSFVTAGERNQCYVDGGIFLMSLLYSLQYLGLGACTLNWSVEKCDDKRLRKQFPVNSSENIIAFIAVGHLKDRFQVPVSSRLPTEDILRIL